MNPAKPGDPADAIAIVGVGCRLPGGITTLGELWSALVARRDLIGEMPSDRFDSTRLLDPSRNRPGKSYTFACGFLDNVSGFDAGFFGVSPAEASRIDPQQRLLLELAVEALDDAGIAPSSVVGSDCGVYVGVSNLDYLTLQYEDPKSINAYTQSGGISCNNANRLSHWFDLVGPSVAMDTACSSSLVALHQACESLRAGESPMALVGGVNILINPYDFVGFAKAAMLSATGRCHTFSAAADGYVRSEGGAVIVLKPLAAAQADGDRVHGVILASGTNSDGRTLGLFRPSADAQEALLRRVYDRAGVAPDDVSYVEAHGTGTLVGDITECEAMGRALGARRSAGRNLPIGSIKSNIGHLEPASGLAGVLKGLLVLRHGVVPAFLHTLPANPEIDFAGWQLEPATEAGPVARSRPDQPVVVGVSSFGMGGVNAHVVLSEPAPSLAGGQATPVLPAAPRQLPLLVSARSPEALELAVQRMAEALADAPPQDFYDLCWTACRRRGRHERAVAVLAEDAADAAGKLEDLGRDWAPGPEAPGGDGRLVFAFSGNGSQWGGMGADLLRSEPAFREAVEEVDCILEPLIGWSIVDELAGPSENHRLERTEVAQPALFALQVGLVHLLRAQGIIPHAVVGHSVGEVAAAYAAGALDLATAALVVAERSRAQGVTAHQGGMAAIGLAAAEAITAIAPYGSDLELAAINSDQDVTVAGASAALDALGDELAGADVFFRMLDIAYPFHCRAMDAIKADLAAALAGVDPSAPRIPMASTVTGRLLGADDHLDGDYWWRNVREPVRFGPAVKELFGQGYRLFLEVGPHPVLGRYLRRVTTTSPDGRPAAVMATMSKGGDGVAGVANAVTSAMAAGAKVDWDTWFPRPGRVVALPAYPWQRERHWNGTAQAWGRSAGDGPRDHSLLGARLASIEPTWSGPLERTTVPWLDDHRVGGTVVMPGAAFVEMALAAGRRVLDRAVEVDRLDINRALVVPWDDDSGDVELQVSMADEDGVLRIASRTGTAWQVHARGRVRPLLAGVPDPIDLPGIQAALTGRLDPAELYRRLDRVGMQHGPRFQVLRQLWTGDDEVLAAYEWDGADGGFEAHPALLDGALQAGCPLLADQTRDQLFLPAMIEGVKLWRSPSPSGYFHVRARSVAPSEACYDVTIVDGQGQVAALMEGCWMRRADAGAYEAPRLLRTVLRAAPRPGAPIAPLTLPYPDDVVAGASSALADAVAAYEAYEGFELGLRDLQAAFVARAVAQLLPGTASFTARDLRAAGVLATHSRLVDLLLGAAARSERLLRVGSGYRLVDGGPGPEAVFQRLVAEFPETVNALTVCGRCGSQLVDILCGRRDPSQMLLAESERAVIEQLPESSPSQLESRIMAALLEQVLSRWPAGRPVRVLEVGAGTGATSAVLLPLLPPERTQYTFADGSTASFPRAQVRLAAYDFVDYQCIDLDSGLREQNVTEAGYDIVVAASVLHTTTDLRAALRRIAFALDDGGLLLAAETHDSDVHGLSFALLGEYWRHTDTELRPSSPLLPRDAWPPLLHRCEFADVALVGDAAERGLARGTIVLARRGARLAGATTAAAPPVVATPQDGDGGNGSAGPAWLVVADPVDDELVRRLSAELGTFAPVPRVVAHDDVARWEALVTAPGGPPRIVILTSEENSASEPDLRAVEATMAVARTADILRAIAIACAPMPPDRPVSLWLVARPSGALPAPERGSGVADAGAWGIARCLANEEPGLAVRRISLERGTSVAEDARRLAHELSGPSDEDEIVLTGGGRFVPRVVDWAPPVHPAGDGARVPYVLELRDAGPSYRLAWVEADPPTPAPDEVVIDVRAVGLNYLDIMVATGRMPVGAHDRAADVSPLGDECAGIVAAVGAHVTTLHPGDRVVALTSPSLASHVVAKAGLTARIPEGMTFTGAATLPLVFFTVHYSLEHLARLAQDEVMLVHSASGGVGLAALQYARHRGAEVIATAGTSSKRALLRLLGVTHVLDSRSLEFAHQVRSLTGGRGVDVVVNSLAGEAIPRSLELLRAHGRFVELGKRDIYASQRLSLGAFRKNRTLFAVDAAPMVAEGDQLATTVFTELAERVRLGTYRPLPHQVFPASRVEDAFTHMQHSRHLGKVVVSFEQAPVVERRRVPSVMRPDATYLVTGGLGGFGGAAAGWLASRGAGHLALVSRRGADAPEAPDLIGGLRKRGVTVTAYQADASDRSAMGGVLAAIAATGFPLRGVVHAAAHFDDGRLRTVDRERFESVVRPKMLGGLVIDELTRGLELDLFVAFSSVTALIGNVAQAGYVAGNLALEALVRARRQAGRAGLAVGWGAIGDIGYVARNDLGDTMERLGVGLLAVPEALQVLDQLLGDGADVVVSGRFDWERLGRMLPVVATPRFGALVPAPDLDGRPDPEQLHRRLQSATADDARALVIEELVSLAAAALQTTPDRVDAASRMDRLGMDSLTATALGIGIRRRLRCEIAPLDIIGSPSLADLADRLVVRIQAKAPERVGVSIA